jgi:hypothetical protein
MTTVEPVRLLQKKKEIIRISRYYYFQVITYLISLKKELNLIESLILIRKKRQSGNIIDLLLKQNTSTTFLNIYYKKKNGVLSRHNEMNCIC